MAATYETLMTGALSLGSPVEPTMNQECTQLMLSSAISVHPAERNARCSLDGSGDESGSALKTVFGSDRAHDWRVQLNIC
jgi:hypothetical protein